MDDFRMTWARVRNSDAIEAIEHPVTGTPMPKVEFEREFGPVLEEMAGDVPSDHFDFYFVQCDICNFIWRFRDDDARHDFMDAAIELGCLPTLKEYHEGESKEEKMRRSHVSRHKVARIKYGSGADRPQRRRKARNQLEQLYQTLEALRAKLAVIPESQHQARAATESKIARVIAMMEKSA